MSEQQDVYFRPPSEAESFLIRVMRGCSHNRCTFCNMYKGIPFEILPLEEVLAGIVADSVNIGPKALPLVTSLYLEGGDPLALPTQHLVRIMHHAREYFPYLTRIACYATARSINHKSPEELSQLAQNGLTRLHVGVESGLDEILQRTCKGSLSADLLKAGIALKDAGIENDVSIMLGIGGAGLSRQHAIATGELLSAVFPACVRIRTFVPNIETPLGDAFLAGEFKLLDPYETLEELKVLVHTISAPMLLLSEHWTDFLFFVSNMPEEAQALIAKIDEALTWPREAFREEGICTERQ